LLSAGYLKTEPVSHDPLRHHRTETVNVVITAVLLASLVCLLIVGGIARDPGDPARPRPSTEPPLTNGSSQLDPSHPDTTGSAGR
jgi:hypothetical protein